MEKKSLLLGAHMSITGGLEKAIIRAQEIGCTAVQFFSKSNRQWQSKPLTEQEVSIFKKTLAESSIISTTIHACYLINIGSPDPEIALKSRNALAEEYARACELDVHHLVFHPGSHLQTDETACLERIAEHINSILASAPASKTKLVLETMAGQGSGVCHTFEHLAYIIERIEQKERIGICLDTCHVFAAGYNIAGDYHKVIEDFDRIIGLSFLEVIHLNDSKKELGSRVDRHEHIGQGHIGIEAFKLLVTDHRLHHVSKILETPKETDSDDIRNIETVKKLYGHL